MAETHPIFDKALNAYGADYLAAEKELRAGGTSTASSLQQIAADTTQTPLARFVAGTIAAWIDGKGSNYEVAMSGLDGLAARAAKTPSGTPAADVAAGRLKHYDDIANFVALRLLKETDWPQWKVLAAVVYLGYWGTASVLPALEQFRSDLKAGKRPALGDLLDVKTKGVIEQLDGAAELVRIVIEDETFEKALETIKGEDTGEQSTTTEMAIAKAVSLIVADNERARTLDGAITTVRSLLLNPVLRATEGVVAPDEVRRILADYVLGTGKGRRRRDSGAGS
jgi:hypothetical protein